MINNLASLISDPVGFLRQLIMILPGILIGLTVHEWAHAYVAFRCGDPTAKNLGRMTLNPLYHVDPVGFLCLLLLGFGWAKPVPVRPNNFRNYKRDELLVSLAGIGANCVTALLFTLLMYILIALMPSLFENGVMMIVLMEIILTNLSLMVFNLIPLYPLDGSRVFELLLMRRIPKVCMFLRTYGRYIMIALLCSGAISAILSPVVNWFYNWMSAAGYFVYSLISHG